MEFAQETLRDLLTVRSAGHHHRQHPEGGADYYQLRVKPTCSRSAHPLAARPRQVAMALAKELTEHSCPRSAMRSAGATTPRCCTPAVDPHNA
jgi:chromosomal replication initiator protein